MFCLRPLNFQTQHCINIMIRLGQSHIIIHLLEDNQDAATLFFEYPIFHNQHFQLLSPNSPILSVSTFNQQPIPLRKSP